MFQSVDTGSGALATETVMAAIHIRKTVEKDGEISLTGLPVKEGQQVEITVEIGTATPTLTARQLAESELVGLWADREDIRDSVAFARQLREQAQRRQK